MPHVVAHGKWEKPPTLFWKKRIIMNKDLPWILKKIMHWLWNCAKISHKAIGLTVHGGSLPGIKVVAIECSAKRIVEIKDLRSTLNQLLRQNS